MKKTRYQITAEVVIEKPCREVWEVLTDFSRYPEWNPFIRIAKGQPVKNRKIFIVLTIPPGWFMFLNPSILEIKQNHYLKWLGSLVVEGLFDGEHLFKLVEEGENKTRLIQQEKFTGLLVPYLGKFVGRGAKRGFDAMNAALKKRVEAIS